MAGGVRVGVAFDDVTLAPTPTFTYLTDTPNLVAGYEIDRGRQYEFDKVDAGQAKVTIYDRDGLLDPTNTTGPYYGKLQPLLQIKIDLWNPVTSSWSTRFRGFILEYDYSVDPSTHQDGTGATVGVSTLTLDCSDLFAILTKIEMYPDVVSGAPAFGDPVPATYAGNIFFDNRTGQDRITQVLTNALGSAFVAARCVVFTLNIHCQESSYSPGKNVLEVSQEVADAEFPTLGIVYCDREGRFCVHGRLARFDPVGVAADAGSAWDFTNWKVGDGMRVAASPSDTAHIRLFSYNLGWSKVFNYAFCTPNGIRDTDLPGQVSRDDVSIGQFGYCPWSAENLIIGAPTGDPLTGADADTLTHQNALQACKTFADYITANYGIARARITEITFKSKRPTAAGAEANWNLLCGVDINDLVDVYFRAPGDGPTAYVFNGDQFFVEGLTEKAEPLNGEYAYVETSLDLSPRAYFTTGAWSGD